MSEIKEKIKIDKNIPIPSPRGGSASMYPLDTMEIGDSFFIGGVESRLLQIRIMGKAQTKNPKKFTTRTVDGGIRCWRIA